MKAIGKVKVYKMPSADAQSKVVTRVWQSRFTVADLLTLAAAGKATLKTNKELRGAPRRQLRTAVNRALRHVEGL